MTREEAHKEYYSISGVNLSGKKDLIDKIYDDFESRTCDCCKHKYVVDALTIECRNNDSMLEYLDLDCFSDFGCNKFERKV